MVQNTERKGRLPLYVFSVKEMEMDCKIWN